MTNRVKIEKMRLFPQLDRDLMTYFTSRMFHSNAAVFSCLLASFGWEEGIQMAV
ncbi:hypothetical protein BDQ94DRAFT_146481, partial [Aspergillus welwitschiae]